MLLIKLRHGIYIPEEIILENILKDEMKEGILVLEDFKTTIDRAWGLKLVIMRMKLSIT